MRRVTASFDRHEDALKALESLEAAGVPQEQIGYARATEDERPRQGGTATGVATGAFAGLAYAAVAGVGTLGAAGVLAPLVAGAMAGGLVGRLIDGGMPKEEAEIHAEALRRGSTLVCADVQDSHGDRVLSIMYGAGAASVEERRGEYVNDGWQGFDETAAPMTARERAEERKRHEADDVTVMPLPPVH